MSRLWISDELWETIKPLLPPPRQRRFRHPGRKPVDDRKALLGILFVLRTGVPWEDVPGEWGVSGMTCWNRLRDWQAAGVWDRLLEVLLAKLRQADKLDLSRAVIDSSSVRAAQGGEATGPSPVDRAKSGSKHHILTDGRGQPLVARVTSANRNDITQLQPLISSMPPVRGKRGRPRRRPRTLLADRGYDSDKDRRWLRARGIQPFIARRQTPHGSGLGATRWVVERTFAWLHQMRRLRTRFERRLDIHQALLTFGCAVIAQRVLCG